MTLFNTTKVAHKHTEIKAVRLIAPSHVTTDTVRDI